MDGWMRWLDRQDQYPHNKLQYYQLYITQYSFSWGLGYVQLSSENFIYPKRAIQFTAPSSIKLEKKKHNTTHTAIIH